MARARWWLRHTREGCGPRRTHKRRLLERRRPAGADPAGPARLAGISSCTEPPKGENGRTGVRYTLAGGPVTLTDSNSTPIGPRKRAAARRPNLTSLWDF